MAQKKSRPLPEALASLPARYSRSRKYIVAVSGGRDSVALLHALVELGYRKLVIVHLNHRLRGRASGNDARFVTGLGNRLGVAVDACSADVAALAKAESCSIETAARVARHRFFFEAAARHRCRRFLLAHHADDQAETVLMHLFRGSGARGLTGMKESTLLNDRRNSKPIELIRPMLGIRRSEIDAYIAARTLTYRDDASNDADDHLRNRVRRSLLPELNHTFGRDVAPILHRAAEILAEEDALLEKLAGEGLADAVNGARRLSVPVLQILPIALQRRVLRQWLDQQGLLGIGFSEIESIRALLSRRHPAKVNLPGQHHARRRAGQLFIE